MLMFKMRSTELRRTFNLLNNYAVNFMVDGEPDNHVVTFSSTAPYQTLVEFLARFDRDEVDIAIKTLKPVLEYTGDVSDAISYFVVTLVTQPFGQGYRVEDIVNGRRYDLHSDQTSAESHRLRLLASINNK